MKTFTDSLDIEMQTTPPLHPSSNPVETFMRTLGKAMKIGHKNGQGEGGVLHSVLDSYRQTPHPATGISPAAMLFRDSMRTNIPRKKATDTDVDEARRTDKKKKLDNETLINSSKYRKKSKFLVGDMVWVRNYNKSKKFDTLFITEPYQIIHINHEGNKLTVRNTITERVLCRHPDDIKPCVPTEGRNDAPEDTPEATTINNHENWPVCEEEYDENDVLAEEATTEIQPRRSNRARKPNSRFKDYDL
jgi:hypothetical protein